MNKFDLLVEKIYDKVIEKLLESNNSKYEINDKYIYHCAHDSVDDNKGYKAIFKFGFERYFVNKGVGNLYGPGVYTTIDLNSSIINANRGEYGQIIIKAEVKSFDKFLIWNRILAQQVYGENWRIKDQMRLIFPTELIEEMKQLRYQDGSFYSYLIQTDRDYSADLAYSFWSVTKQNPFRNGNPYDYIHGFVFHGRRDGYVAVVKDVKNLIPLSYSKDFGLTWEKGQTEKTLRYTKHDFDVSYHHGKKYDKTTPPEFGWAKVEKGGKVNYINKEGKEISNTWFDGGGNFTEISKGFYMAEIVYDNESYYLTTDGDIYASIEDDYPMCSADELPQYV